MSNNQQSSSQYMPLREHEMELEQLASDFEKLRNEFQLEHNELPHINNRLQMEDEESDDEDKKPLVKTPTPTSAVFSNNKISSQLFATPTSSTISREASIPSKFSDSILIEQSTMPHTDTKSASAVVEPKTPNKSPQQLYPPDHPSPSTPSIRPSEVVPDVFLDSGNAPVQVSVGPNLDHFFKKVYRYFYSKGFWCIFMDRLLQLLIILFVMGFSSILFLLVDWISLWECRSSDCKNVNLLALPQQFSLFHFVVLGIEIVFFVFWLYIFVKYVRQVAGMLEIKHFFNQDLNIAESDLPSLKWVDLVERIKELQKRKRITPVKSSLDESDIVNLIMRKENYLIAFINKDILNLKIPLPYLGRQPILTESLLYNLRIVVKSMFDSDFRIREDFLNTPNELRWKFIWLGLLNFIAMPFILFFLIIYLFFRYSAEVKTYGFQVLFERKWTTYAKYKFKEFNELPHFFEMRLKKSVHPANSYLNQFPNYLLSIIAQSVMFLCSACMAVILAISAIKSDLLVFTNLLNQNLVWWLSILIIVFTTAKSMVIEENQTFDENAELDRVIAHIHYMPSRWVRKGHHIKVRSEFSSLFQPNLVLLAQELLSIIITPMILCFSLPHSAEKIVNFVNEVSTELEGLGNVCGFASFDARFGNAELYGSGHVVQQQTGKKYSVSHDGKMEKSLISFMTNQPNWKPQEDKHATNTLIQKLTDSIVVKETNETNGRGAKKKPTSQLAIPSIEITTTEQQLGVPDKSKNHLAQSVDLFMMLESMRDARINPNHL